MTATLTYNPRNRVARTTMEFIQSLGVFTIEHQCPTTGRTKKQNTTVDPELWNDLKGALLEVKEHYYGNKKLKPVEDLLNEL